MTAEVAAIALLTGLLIAATVGCGGNHYNPVFDADGRADASDDGADGSAEMHVQTPTCESARDLCVGNAVYSCMDNRPGDLVQQCPDSCSLGRCTPKSCADVEAVDGLHGCRFYGVQMDNIDGEDMRNTAVLLSNAGAQPVKASLQMRAGDGTWTELQSALVQPSLGVRLDLSRPVLDPGVSPAAAFRIDTDGPVMAVQLVGDNADRLSRSSGGTVLRPVQAIGRGYLAVTSPARLSGVVNQTAGSRGGAGAITVIATAANTHVHLTLTAPAVVQVPPGVVLDPPPAVYDAPPMDEGDVLQIFSAAVDADLTGTGITADTPVAVFSGNIFTSYGYELSGFNDGDMAEEQLPPTASWGVEYVGARLSPQANCDSFFGAGVGLWRVVAAQDNTRVTIRPAAGVTVDWPNLSPDLTVTLGAGQYQSFWARGDLSSLAPADVVVRADGPILLAQWLDCEPGLAWGIDARLSAGPLSFTLPPGFDHEVAVVKKIGDAMTFDGATLTEDRFTRASPDGDFEVARLTADDLGACQNQFDRCDHLVSGAGFGVTWRGMDVVCSYALTVPSAQTCALPNVDCPR